MVEHTVNDYFQSVRMKHIDQPMKIIIGSKAGINVKII